MARTQSLVTKGCLIGLFFLGPSCGAVTNDLMNARPTPQATWKHEILEQLGPPPWQRIDTWAATHLDSALSRPCPFGPDCGADCRVRIESLQDGQVISNTELRFSSNGDLRTEVVMTPDRVRASATARSGTDRLTAWIEVDGPQNVTADRVLKAMAHPNRHQLQGVAVLARSFESTTTRARCTLHQRQELPRELQTNQRCESNDGFNFWSRSGRTGGGEESYSSRHLTGRLSVSTFDDANHTLSRVVREDLDAGGRLTRMVEEVSTNGAQPHYRQATRWGRDDRGRVVFVSNARGEIGVSYLPDGTSVWHVEGCDERRRVDDHGRLLLRGSCSGVGRVHRDGAGRPTRVERSSENHTSTRSFEYDDAEHLVGVTEEDVLEISATYLPTGRLSSETVREGQDISVLTRTYDHANRIATSTLRVGGSHSSATYEYDGCAPNVEVPLEPGHEARVESPFELIE